MPRGGRSTWPPPSSRSRRAARYRAPSGAVYPVSWTVTIPSRQIALDVATPLENQELATTAAGVTYWEGLIDVRGTAGGRAIRGRGYLEMTGYKGSLGRVMSLSRRPRRPLPLTGLLRGLHHSPALAGGDVELRRDADGAERRARPTAPTPARAPAASDTAPTRRRRRPPPAWRDRR